MKAYLVIAVYCFCILGEVSGFAPCIARQSPLFRRHSAPSTTRRRMVFYMPESLIEEVSTQGVLDQILDESLRTSARRPIMIQFDPSSKAIWRQWRGTVFAQTWPSVLKHMLFAAAVYLLFQKKPSLREAFKDFNTIWAQGLSVTTFTLTFFVNQAYTLWRNCLGISRRLQGKLNDLIMLTTTCAKRVDPSSKEEGGCSRYTTASRQLLLVISRYVRLFNILSYASFARSLRPLVTPQGMRRLVDRGLLTPKEKGVLTNHAEYVTATQRHNCVLQWILRALLEGHRVGHLDEAGFPRSIMGKVTEIRAEANSMEGELRGRMSFAYAHIVQILVDATLWFYPIMAYSQQWSLHMGLLGSGFLTFCYQGLFDLAKRFLDPFHNENFWSGDDALVVETLIAETNAGSLRWVYGLDEMPIPYQTMKKGDFDDYLLPDEGYTAEEAASMKAAKQAEEAATTAKLTPQEYEQRAAEMVEVAKQEYEETKLIMETPAGFEFVPGLDDEGESLPYLYRNGTDVAAMKDHEDDFFDATSNEKYGDFLEAVGEEYEEVVKEDGDIKATVLD